MSILPLKNTFTKKLQNIENA